MLTGEVGEADRGFGDGGWGLSQEDAAGDFFEAGVGVDVVDLVQSFAEFAFEVLGGDVFLAELVAEVLPAEHRAIGGFDAAEAVGEPRVNVEGEGGMFQSREGAIV